MKTPQWIVLNEHFSWTAWRFKWNLSFSGHFDEVASMLWIVCDFKRKLLLDIKAILIENISGSAYEDRIGSSF